MQEKLQILSDVLGRFKKSNDEHLFRCPYCEHSKYKFSVNIDKNVYKCWICDTRGRHIRRIVRRFGTFKQRQAWQIRNCQLQQNWYENISKIEV